MKTKLKLTVVVEYETHGVELNDLKERLRVIPEIAEGNGDFTGTSNAEVLNWSSTVEEIKKRL